MAAADEVGVQVFRAEYDEEGVSFYQAFNDAIADWALEHQALGGPDFRPERMTWIKPSFAWVLYRSGYASKHNQTRILKLKVPHDAVAALLAQCKCQHGGGGSNGRVQWDPERSMLAGDGREPNKMQRLRAIQIGLRGALSAQYVASIARVEDVSVLARTLARVHRAKSADAMASLAASLPVERPYMPRCPRDVLERLALLPGDSAVAVSRIGCGQAATPEAAAPPTPRAGKKPAKLQKQRSRHHRRHHEEGEEIEDDDDDEMEEEGRRNK